MDFAESHKWFKKASLLIFTSQDRPMMHAVTNDEEPSQPIDESDYILKDYRKAAEFKIDTEFFTRSTLTLKLNQVHLYDNKWLPTLEETNKTSYYSIDGVES